jgi:hypothetical protein
VWVPDLSPRETKRALFSAIFFSAAAGALLALDAGGIRLGADDDEVVVHDQATVLHLAFVHVLPLDRRRVRERDVRFAARREGERLPGCRPRSSLTA